MLLLTAVASNNTSAACNGVELDCTIEELDQVRPETIKYHAVISIGGGFELDEFNDESPEDIDVCGFLENAYSQNGTLYQNCTYKNNYLGGDVYYYNIELCQNPDSNGGCQNNSWLGYDFGVNELRECGGEYPSLDLQDNNICHLKREDKHCPKTVDNPICIATLAKKQKFELYSSPSSSPLAYSIYYDSKSANLWSKPNLASHSTATITYIEQSTNFSENLRVDLPNNLRYHFYRYGSTWKAYNSSGGRIEGSNYISSGGKKYTFSSLPTSHQQVVTATSAVKSNGDFVSYSFDEILQKATISDKFGRKLVLQFSLNNQLESLKDPSGLYTNLVYDSQGRLIRIIYPDLNYTELLYENTEFPLYLTGLKDGNGERISTYGYDSNGNAISTQRTNGISTQVSKDSNGVVNVQRFDGANEIYSQELTLQELNERFQITQVKTKECATCPENVQNYEFNSDGFLTAEINEHGIRNEFTRDSNGLVTSSKYAVGKPEQVDQSIIYNSTHKKPYMISKHDGQEYYTYNADGFVTQIRARGYTASDYIMRYQNFEYNSDNLLTKYNGERTDVTDETFFSYDASGNLASTTNALGQVTYFRNYDTHGNAQQIEDPNGLITNLSYNSRQWLTSIDVGGRVTGFLYDAAGNLVRVTNPTNTFIDYEYDSQKRVTAVEDSQGNRIEYSYDGSGNPIEKVIIDPLGQVKNSINSTYNNLTLLEKSQGNFGQKHEVSYDVSGNPISEKNGLNDETKNQFDYFNRLSKTIDPLNGETSSTYDKRGRLASITDPEGKKTSYTYNFFNELTKVISPDTGTTTLTYDKAGNVLTRKDARNETTTYTYDALNRVLTQSYSDTSENIVYSYDDTTNGNKGIGRLTSVTDQSGSTSYFYNAFGQVTKETRVVDGKTYVTEYHFDANGQMTGMTYPSGRQVNYTFDSLNRISGVTTTHNTVTSTLASSADYLPFGPMKSVSYGNGKSLTQTFDLDYRLTDKTTSGIHQVSYGYDVTDNITTITDSLDATKSQTFTYDKLSRLLSANGGYGSLGFTYDKIGNRLSKTDNNNVDTYAYATDAHRLLNITGSNANTFTHDAIGNTLTKGDLTFTYNKQGRLKSASKTGMNAEYVYNFQGQRVSKQVDGVTTHFVYDLNGQLIAEADSTGTIIKEYAYLNGQRLSVFENGATYFVHTDHLGTPIALSDSTGTVQWKAHYTPFGKAIVEVNNLSQNIRFPGQYFDSESGLHYNYFRDYDPEIGRYIQSDPIGLAGGINTYGYGHQNPIMNTDPLGLYSPEAHDALLSFAFRNTCLSQHDIAVMQLAGRRFDELTQQESLSAWHSLLQAGQSISDMQAQRSGFISDVSDGIRSTPNRGIGGSGRIHALQMFGYLAHPIMDSYSPAHNLPDGTPSTWDLGDLSPSGLYATLSHSPFDWWFWTRETTSDITPGAYEGVRRDLQKLYNELFGDCECSE